MIPGSDAQSISQSIAQAPKAPGVDSTAAGMDAIGQMTLSMLVVVGLILACYWLIKRLNSGTGLAKKHLKVVSSSLVGAKERVVIVEVRDTWLVLGVGNGNVNKLHELPKPDDLPEEAPSPLSSFATRLSEMRTKDRP